MLKKFLCGAAMLTMLGGAATPTQAEELYVRNRPFKDAYFIGQTTYVPVEGFLRAVEVPWTIEGPYMVLGRGDSPDWTPAGDVFAALKDGEQFELKGMVRGGELYVPAKELAEFVGYGVMYNQATGIVDVIKARETTAADRKAAQDVADANAAEKKARDEAWKARVDKAKADRKAKEEAAKKATGDDGDKDAGDTDVATDKGNDEQKLAAKGKEDTDVSDTKDSKIDGKEDGDLADYDKTTDSDDKDVKDEGPPPVADLVVLSSEAIPNNYTGEVQFRAVLQNQGYAGATDVKAEMVVIGPDNDQWLKKTYYHPPMKPDARWEIVENYKHRLGSAIPRGNYDVKVTPTFQTEAAKK